MIHGEGLTKASEKTICNRLVIKGNYSILSICIYGNPLQSNSSHDKLDIHEKNRNVKSILSNGRKRTAHVAFDNFSNSLDTENLKLWSPTENGKYENDFGLLLMEVREELYSSRVSDEPRNNAHKVLYTEYKHLSSRIISSSIDTRKYRVYEKCLSAND